MVSAGALHTLAWKGCVLVHGGKRKGSNNTARLTRRSVALTPRPSPPLTQYHTQQLRRPLARPFASLSTEVEGSGSSESRPSPPQQQEQEHESRGLEEVSDEEFQKLVEELNGQPFIVDWAASWCR